MSAQNRTTNKARFEDGDTATGSNFSDLIDSFVSLTDTAAQNVASDLRAANLITPGKVSAATLNLSTFQASTVSAAHLVGANLTSQTSAQMSGTLNVVGAATFAGTANFASTVTATNLLYANTSAALCLASGGGTSGVVLTTAGNPISLNAITSAGGNILVRGFVKMHVEGTIVCVPFFYSTS